MREAQRLFCSRPVDFLEFFGQPDNRNVPQAELFEFRASSIELAFASVDQNEIWQNGAFRQGSRPAMGAGIGCGGICAWRKHSAFSNGLAYLVDHLLQFAGDSFA